MAAFQRDLSEPVEHFGAAVARVYLLEPRANHLARYGEPQQSVYNGKTGSGYAVDNDEAIAKYLDDLLSIDGKTPADGGGRALFGTLALEDGIALRDALFDFFGRARLKIISARSTL